MRFDALQSARAELNLAASLPVDAEPPMDDGGDARIIANDPTVIQARLAAERAAEDLRQATVVAPLDGTVTGLEATLGNHLGAGHPVATVETLDDILAGVQIDEVDIGKIQLGQQVVLTTETLRDVELLGTITLVPPSMEATGSVPLVTIDVDVDEDSLPEGARLLAGSSCRARIDAELKQDATAVPYAALLERAGATIAFVAIPVEGEDGQYVLERREVSHRRIHPQSGRSEGGHRAGRAGRGRQSGAAARRAVGDGRAGATGRGGACRRDRRRAGRWAAG